MLRRLAPTTLALALAASVAGCTVPGPGSTPTPTAAAFDIGVQDNEFEMLAIVCTDARVTRITARAQQPGEWDDEWIELVDETDPEPHEGPRSFEIGPPELLWEGDRLVVEVETTEGGSVLELTVPKYRIPSDHWLFASGEGSACPNGMEQYPDASGASPRETPDIH